MENKLQVFYKSDTKIKKDEEFYEIKVTAQRVIKVEVFHGLTGAPPKGPENIYQFDVEEQANTKIEQIITEIKSLGFSPYLSQIHGILDF